MKWRIVALAASATILFGQTTAGRPQEEPSAARNMDVAMVVEGHNSFAIDMYNELGKEPGNLFFSPFSISMALAMTYAGARNQTAREMAAVAHFPGDQQLLHSVQSNLLAELDPEDHDRPYQLGLANRLWGQPGYEFLPSFLRTCRENYGAPLAVVDFVRDPEQARLTINDWVAERTEQKILDLLRPGDVGHDTPLVLTNAIYFRGTWSQPFPTEMTSSGRFYLSENEWIDTAMMRQRGRFAQADFGDLALLQLPYRAGELALVVLLPKHRQGLSAVEEDLDPARLREWLAALKEQEMIVSLPEFKLASRFELGRCLQAMGMTTAFDARADFSGMTGSRGLWIDEVVHEARVEVNEEGTEAAAATAVVMRKMHPVFKADHPFLFLIRDLRNDSILFMGRLADPRTD